MGNRPGSLTAAGGIPTAYPWRLRWGDFPTFCLEVYHFEARSVEILYIAVLTNVRAAGEWRRVVGGGVMGLPRIQIRHRGRKDRFAQDAPLFFARISYYVKTSAIGQDYEILYFLLLGRLASDHSAFCEFFR